MDLGIGLRRIYDIVFPEPNRVELIEKRFELKAQPVAYGLACALDIGMVEWADRGGALRKVLFDFRNIVADKTLVDPDMFHFMLEDDVVGAASRPVFPRHVNIGRARPESEFHALKPDA